jgi:CHAT domain-containing protein/tetratricopeptide (TPR) repeat protein
MVGRFKSAWLLHLLVTGPILAALPQNTQVQDAHRLIEEADRVAMLYNWQRAGPLYSDAETRFNQSGDSKNTLYARLGLAWVQANTDPRPELENQIDEQMQSPLVQGNARLLLRCLVTKAAIDQEKNEASSRDNWERILELAKSLDDKRWQARAQAELGIISFLEGDVKTSTEMLKTALLSLFMQGDYAAAIYYGSVVGNGMVETGQAEAGLQYCETALKSAATIKDMGFPFMAYEGKARALIALHREAEAKQVLDLAVRQAKAQNARISEIQLLIVMAKQAAASDRNKAIEYLKTATALSKEAGLPHGTAWSTFELANIYRDKGDLNSAEKYETQAIGAMQEVQDKYHLPLHLALLAELAAKRGKIAEANRLYDQAADVVEGMLVSVPTREVESSLIAVESQLYLGHFNLAATKLHDVGRAFETLETARGRTIADALRSEPVRVNRSDPDTRSAQQRINRIQLSLLRETDRSKRQEMLEELFKAEQVLVLFSKPETYLQKAVTNPRPVGLPRLQKSLRPDEMVLEYVLDEPRSFCLHITRRGAAVATLSAGRKHVEELVENYLAGVRSRKSVAEIGKELYLLLLRPIPGADSTSRLIIVPDGKLHLLPFDSLTDDQGRYFLESHIVTYAPSSTVLNVIRTSPVAHQPRQTFLGVGDVQYTQAGITPNKENSAVESNLSAVSSLADPFDLAGARLQDIPMTRDEVIGASKVFGGRITLLLGREATEAAFKAQPLADFQIIHIAAHGIASAKFPDRAALVLGSDPKSGEDGLLQVREIRSLSLNANLVTLSACDTGVGRLQGEEGIANLVRAFLFAGAKSVVASLWAANDISTTTLMQHFYRYLADGEDKGAALRHAKLDLIKEFGDQALPFYWAGFVMVGDGSKSIPISRPVVP